jgi:hypothetical protein
MKKVAFLAITALGLAVVMSVIGYVVGQQYYAPSSVSETLAGPMSPVDPPPTATPVPSPFPSATLSPPPTLTLDPTPGPTAAPAPTPTPMAAAGVPEGASVYHGKQPPYLRSECSPCTPADDIRLENERAAIDPTWEQLEAFLLADLTDANPYVPGVYVCGAFAEDLHNNAEAVGIRAAWVAVDFAGDPDGHALNAFNTVDRGLVFVDSTGRRPGEEPEGSETTCWDKVAYMAIGEEYGQISFSAAECPDYTCYEDYLQEKADFDTALDEYNDRVDAHNANVIAFEEWTDGKTFIAGTEDAARMQEWYDSLKEEEAVLEALSDDLLDKKQGLGTLWEPMGTVSSIGIYW